MFDKIKSHIRGKRWLGILAGAVLVLGIGVQATMAFLSTGTEPIVNVFKPMEYRQGQISVSKMLRHSFGANYEIPDDIVFDFKLRFESKGSRSATESALRFSSTESSYKLKSTTPNAYAGYTFNTNYGTYTADENGEFLFKLKPGQEMKISNIDEGTMVTVSELSTDLPGFYIDGSDTQQLVVSADTFGAMQFINVYAPDYDKITTDYDVYIDKTFTGRAMQQGDSFTFVMEYYDPDHNNADADGWVAYSHTDVLSLNANGADAIFDEYNGLSDFKFKEPGIYSFRVSEAIPADNDKLKDVTYDTGKYIFTVEVTDNDMDGALEIGDVMPGTNSQDKVEINRSDKEIIVSFTNTYKKTDGGGGSGGGGSGTITPSKPEENPKVPDMLKGSDHFAYVFGYPDGTVQPEGLITRAEVAAIFSRLTEDNIKAPYVDTRAPFADVAHDAWYASDVAIMYGLGIVGGYPDGTFKPDAPITRAEFTAMASRLDDLTVQSTREFPDIAGHWAEEAILLCVEAGWIGGYEDGTMRPDRYITRAETMAIINHVLCRTPETIDDLHEDMIHWPDNADTTKWYYITVQEATNGHQYAWKDESKEYEYWTALDNEEEKQSFLIRWLHSLLNKD